MERSGYSRGLTDRQTTEVGQERWQNAESVDTYATGCIIRVSNAAQTLQQFPQNKTKTDF